MRRLLLTVSLLISIPLTLQAQQRELGGKEHIQMGTERPLEEAFLHPSDAAKPIMIWQWMDGVVSKEGITADLEAFKAAGISGVQQFWWEVRCRQESATPPTPSAPIPGDS